MNNPIAQMLLQKIANNNQALNNPMFINAMQMYKSGDQKGLQQMAENLCRTKGTTPDEIAKQYNLK